MATVNIEDKLYESIKEYCKLNKLVIGTFVNDLLRKNFMVEKYDEMPPFFKQATRIVNIMVESAKEEDEKMAEEKGVEPIDVSELIYDEPKSEKNEPKKEENEPKPEDKKDKELTPKERARLNIRGKRYL